MINFKPLLSTIGGGVLSVGIATGMGYVSTLDGDALMQSAIGTSTFSETTDGTASVSTPVSAIESEENVSLLSQMTTATYNSYNNDFTESPRQALTMPGEKAELMTAQMQATNGARKSATLRHAAKVNTGTVIVKDYSKSNELTGTTCPFSAVDPDDLSQGYKLENVYNTDVAITMQIDTETGVVTVPAQVVMNHSTYGEVSFVKAAIINDQLYVDLKNPLVGTIDENGVIDLGPWAIIITNTESDYYMASFLSVRWSQITVPNATGKAVYMKSNETIEYPMLIEQDGTNAVTMYGLFHDGNVSLTGRLTSSKTVVVPSQLIFTTSSYGNFYSHPASWTYDESTSAWKYSVNTTDPMVFTTDSDNSWHIDGWVASAATNPTNFIGYAYRDVNISTTAQITWPEKVTNNFDGSGTKSSPYIIKTSNDLLTLGQLVSEGEGFSNTYFALGNDIDMTSVSAANYVPVGDSSTPFQGTFDGKGYTISNLSVNGTAFDYTGVFGYLGNKATVKDLKIASFNGKTTGACLGTIAGASYGTITNCEVTSATLDSDGSCAGGIAGLSLGSIDGCSFSGDITAYGTGAGIVGQATGSISNCHVIANITTDGYNSSCYENAGIAGYLTKGTLTNCWSTGTITDSYGRSASAGLVGRCYYSTVENSFTSSFISAKRSYTSSTGGGDNFTAGLIGCMYESTMNNCYSSSTIYKTGTSDYVGGLVGYLNVSYTSSTGYLGTKVEGMSSVNNCYYTGYVSSSSTSATKGIYGSYFTSGTWTGGNIDELTFKNCYYDKQVNFATEDYYGRETSFFSNGLPEGYSSDIWQSTTGYYPTLKNVGTGTQAQALSSAPINIASGQSAKKVKFGFTVTPADNVTWSVAGGSYLLKMDGNEVTATGQYGYALMSATTADGTSTKKYYLSIVPRAFDGDGTAENPFKIKTVVDLFTLDAAIDTYGQSHTGDYFVMTDDIDVSAVNEVFTGVAAVGSGYMFGGHFDGQGHSIKNFDISTVTNNADGVAQVTSSKSYCGLFGITTADAVISNVVIDKSCSFEFYTNSGAIVGLNQGKIENCRNYAKVVAVTENVGGIVGVNYSNATVTGCYNAGDIDAGTKYVGGIAGYNYSGAVITASQNDGVITGKMTNAVNDTETRSIIGGIAGMNVGTIKTSVNNAEISADAAVAGIAGQNSRGSVVGCVNNGLITANDSTTTQRGAIIGNQASIVTIANNCYDASINVNGGSNNTDITGISALSTSELIAGTCPAALNADGVAELYDFTANSYPVLKQFANEEATKTLRSMYIKFAPGQVRNNLSGDINLAEGSSIAWSISGSSNFKVDGNRLSVTAPTDMSVVSAKLQATSGSYVKSYALSSVPEIFSGNGSVESPYLIESKEDWNKLADFVETSKWEYSGSHFKVTKDIDFAGDSIKVIAHDGVNFQGTLDGDGHTVKGYIYSNKNSSVKSLTGANLYLGKNIGIFGSLGSLGTIKNLTIDGTFEGYGTVGALCGSVYGTVENVKHQGTVSSATGSGCAGIADIVYSSGSISDCENVGSVTSKTTQAVGIARETKVGSVLTRCYNRGTVKSTTSYASGIAYKVGGGLVECGNEKPLSATGYIAAVASTMDSTAYAVKCYNIADINLSTTGSYVNGLFYTLATRYVSSKPEQIPSGGYIEDCYNTGDLTGKDYVAGLVHKINSGWNLTGCYNSGNITSAGIACGAFNTAVGSAAVSLVNFDRCYNLGAVSGSKAGCAGFMYSGSYYTKFTNCYNAGKVVNGNKKDLYTGGLFAQFNGYMDHCYNLGDVESGTNAVAGLAGMFNYGKVDYPGFILNSYNLGNITSAGYTGTSANGNAAGLVGYVVNSIVGQIATIDGCFNAGNVTAQSRVAGLVAGLFSSLTKVTNCYNSGRVTCTETVDDKSLTSGTIYYNNETSDRSGETLPTDASCANLYYDKTVSPDAEYRTFAGSALTTSQLKDVKISDSFETLSHGGYPVLKGFEDASGSEAASIMVLLNDESAENHDNVTGKATLIAPAGTIWTVYDADKATEASAMMTIEESTALPKVKGDVTLVATTPAGLSRSFKLHLNPEESGVSTVSAGSEVLSVTYIDMQGRIITNPVQGNVYIVRTAYSDGTSSVAKVVVR